MARYLIRADRGDLNWGSVKRRRVRNNLVRSVGLRNPPATSCGNSIAISYR